MKKVSQQKRNVMGKKSVNTTAKNIKQHFNMRTQKKKFTSLSIFFSFSIQFGNKTKCLYLFFGNIQTSLVVCGFVVFDLFFPWNENSLQLHNWWIMAFKTI